MEEHQCYQLVFSSSATVYGDAKSPLIESNEIGFGVTNPYGQTKFMIERILKDVTISNPKSLNKFKTFKLIRFLILFNKFKIISIS